MPCVVVSSCTLVSSLWNAKNWPCPAIEYLEALVSIIVPVNFVEVSIVVTVYLHASIPWQDIVSLLLFLLASVLLLFISPRISYPGQASFFKIYLNHSSQLINTVVILG